MQRFTFDHAIADVLHAPTDKFTDLVELAGLDRKRDLRRADLSDCDFSDCDLSGYDFTGARLEGSVFHRAYVASATFDTRTIRSGILSTAADYAMLGNREVVSQSEDYLEMLEYIGNPVPFLWEEELRKVVGCLRAGKCVNLVGARGSGRTFLLTAVSAFLERRFDAKNILVGYGSDNLGEALLRAYDEHRMRSQKKIQKISLTKFQPTAIFDAIEKISTTADDVIYLIDNADDYDRSDLSELIANRDAAKKPIVLVSRLPLEPDGLVGPDKKLVMTGMHPLDKSSIVTFLKVLFHDHKRVDVADLVPVTEGLNIGQVSRIASAFDQSSSLESVIKRVFMDDISKILPIGDGTFDRDRDTAARICWAIQAKKVGGVTMRQIARKSRVPLDIAIAVVDLLRSAGLVVRHGRRGFRFANDVLGNFVIDVLGDEPVLVARPT